MSNTRIMPKRESGFYWIEGLMTGAPIISWYDQEEECWTIAGCTPKLVTDPVVLSNRLVLPSKVSRQTKAIYLTAEELIQCLQTLTHENRKKPLRLELGFSGDRVLPFNAHDAWCEEDDDVIVLKVQ